MEISGFQKLTLKDYPGLIASILFTFGCNFFCPFCHNSSLVLPQNKPIPEDHSAILQYLEQRKNLLEGVVITGGEPLLHSDLEDMLRTIHSMGYKIKLDTNGSLPKQLEILLNQHLVDYVALDIKAPPENYSVAIGTKIEHLIHSINKTILLLRSSSIPFEFRTTLVDGIHQENDIEAMAAWIQGEEPYFLQTYVNSGNVINPKNLKSFEKDSMNRMLHTAKKYCPHTTIRGDSFRHKL